MLAFNLYLLITPAVMVFLGCALLVAWNFDRSQRALWWMAMGVYSTGLPLGIQSILSPAGISHYAIYTAVFYLLGAWCIGCSIAFKFHAPYAHRLALAVGVLVWLGIFYYSRVDDQLSSRAFILCAGLGVLQMAPLFRALTYRPRKDLLDAILYWTYLAFCFYTTLRPLMFMLFEQLFIKDLNQSVYWFVTLLTSILFCMTFTFLLLGSSIRSTLKKLYTERNLDPLTNLLNRRAFDESVAQHVERRNVRPVSVVIGDIDHFKQINDRWGHDTGDEVLRQLALCLRQSTRNNDLVARFGGEEFVLVLPHTDAHATQQIIERVQRLLEQGCCTQPDQGKVTMSFGVAGLQDDETMQEALKRADLALYQAKQTGRNRICIHTPQQVASGPSECLSAAQ